MKIIKSFKIMIVFGNDNLEEVSRKCQDVFESMGASGDPYHIQIEPNYP